MGYPTHRPGWYIPYWMDRLIFGIRAHSADRVIPELQHVAVGDHPLPLYRDVTFSWAFVLDDVGLDSRLIMRARVSYTPVGPTPIVRLMIAAGFGIGDVVQAGAMLGGIKARAESGGRDRFARRGSTVPDSRSSETRLGLTSADPCSA
jgi:hypothetical protein